MAVYVTSYPVIDNNALIHWGLIYGLPGGLITNVVIQGAGYLGYYPVISYPTLVLQSA